MSFVLCGLSIEDKAALVREQLEEAVGPAGLTWRLARTDRPDAASEEAASALLTVYIHDADPLRAGRRFAQAAVELALASYPGCTLTTPPGDATPYGVFTADYIGQSAVEHVAVRPDGSRVTVAPPTITAPLAPSIALPTITAPPATEPPAPPRLPAPDTSPSRPAPLGHVIGARSGDKGGDANLGVWARTDEAYAWLRGYLSTDRLVELLPEAAGLTVLRYELPNLRALNFVLCGLLGLGVAASTRFDPQAKALGEWLRSRVVDVPVALLGREAGA